MTASRKEYMKEYMKEYRQRPEYKERMKKWGQKQSSTMTVSYIKSLLRAHGIPAPYSQTLIEIKREQMMLYRALHSIKKEIKDGTN